MGHTASSFEELYLAFGAQVRDGGAVAVPPELVGEDLGAWFFANQRGECLVLESLGCGAPDPKLRAVVPSLVSSIASASESRKFRYIPQVPNNPGWKALVGRFPQAEGAIYFGLLTKAPAFGGSSGGCEKLGQSVAEGSVVRRAIFADESGSQETGLPIGEETGGDSPAMWKFVGLLLRALWGCHTQTSLLQTRLRHMKNEHQVLRASQAAAINEAIEERDKRLREQETHIEQLQRVMMLAADGIFIANEQGFLESFNEQARRIFGYKPEEVLGKRISLIFPELLAPTAGPEATHTVLKSLEGGLREVIGRRKDGVSIPIELGVSRVWLGDRWVYTGIFRDITQRKQSEETLRRLHLQNQMILDAAGEGIVGLDTSRRIVFANPAAAKMLGWPVAELVGRFWHETVHHTSEKGDPLPRDACAMCAGLFGDQKLICGHQTFWRRDGSAFPADYTVSLMVDRGRCTGAVVTFRDVGEKLRLEAHLRQAQKLESIGQLAVGIAHEINTPTQYIGDNLRFLREGFEELQDLLKETAQLVEIFPQDGPKGSAEKSDLEAFDSTKILDELGNLKRVVQATDLDYLLEEIPQAIQQALEGVERVTKIVRSMKEFSHPHAGQKQPFDLNRGIESTLTVSRNEWKYVAEVVTDFEPNLPLVVCFPDDINQMILNLVVNAAHAIGDKVKKNPGQKGTITVSTRRDGPMVEIRIQDTGMGIPEKIQSRIFEPFFTTKEVGRGTGQGLAIVRSIVVDRHGGTIDFQTQEGVNTTFIVRLPIEPLGKAPSVGTR